MSPESDNSLPDTEARRFDDLAIRYWDGSLDEAGLAELNTLLAARSDLRATFNELSLHVLTLAERGAATKASELVPAGKPSPRRFRGLLPWAVAVVVALAGLTALLWTPAPTSPVASNSTENGEHPGNAGPQVAVNKVYVKNADGDVQPVEQWAVSFIDPEPETSPALPPDTFLARFSQPLQAGWRGELVFDRLPEGSDGALRTAPQPHPKWGFNHVVATPNAWKPGLFAIQNDSWLHVRFRLDKPGFFHVLVVAREPEIARRSCVVLEAPHFFQNRTPGQWHTAHLPFAKFRPTEPNRPSERPLVAFIVVFDSQKEDRALTIERFWVTRGPDAQ